MSTIIFGFFCGLANVNVCAGTAKGKEYAKNKLFVGFLFSLVKMLEISLTYLIE